MADLADQLADQLGDAQDLVLVFVPAGYDLDEAARVLSGWAGPAVVGCTSAGGIGSDGYTPDALVAVALSSPDMTVRTIKIGPLEDLERAVADAQVALARAMDDLAGRPTFAVLLSDGLSLREEALADAVMARLGDIPLIGGSAGDDLRFERTAVLADGQFRSGTATLTLVGTSAPWRRFRIQHHHGGAQVAVVTDADASQRLVRTLNGRPALAEYAAMVGVEVGDLNSSTFSAHPLVLPAGGGEWLRSIWRPEADGSLRFLSAAERGAVLRLGQSLDPVAALTDTFTDLEHDLGQVGGTLIFDCVLRRLEFQDLGIAPDVSGILRRHAAVGFSTYGEQFDGVHVNQTMVGVAFGG